MRKVPTGRGRPRGIRRGAAAAFLLLAIALPAAADPGTELEKVRNRKEQVESEKAETLAKAADVSDRVAELDDWGLAEVRRQLATGSSADPLTDEQVEAAAQVARAELGR